jgi:hypothetical protein
VILEDHCLSLSFFAVILSPGDKITAKKERERQWLSYNKEIFEKVLTCNI